jgi:hypothetical protein
MPTYDDFVGLARMCWRQAHVAQTDGARDQLRKMAREYQQEAAKLDSGKLPDLAGGGGSKPFGTDPIKTG